MEFMHMFGYGGGMMFLYSAFAIVSWLAVIGFLIAGIYFFTKKSDK